MRVGSQKMDSSDVTISSEIRSQEEVALANTYACQHERLDNFIFMYAVPSRLFKKYGIELYSQQGYFLLFGLFLVIIFIPGLILTALTSQWDEMNPIRLAGLAIVLSALNVLALFLAQTAAFKISALHRTLRDLEQIQALISWDRVWFGPKISALMGSTISVVLLAILYWLNFSVNGISLPATILWICAVVTIFLGQFSFSTMMIFYEFKKLSACCFELYKLNPYDTFQIQRTSTGLKQLGLVSTITLPLFLLVLLIVLPGGSSLNVPVTGGFLFMSYLATAIGILFPLGFLGDIIKAEKWRLLNPLQVELNQLATKLQALSKNDYEYFMRLQTSYQNIRNTRDSFLSIGAIARIIGTLLLATFSVVLPAVIQRFL